jgi:hypothetical protein
MIELYILNYSWEVLTWWWHYSVETCCQSKSVNNKAICCCGYDWRVKVEIIEIHQWMMTQIKENALTLCVVLETLVGIVDRVEINYILTYALLCFSKIFVKILSSRGNKFLKLFWNYADIKLELYNSSLLWYRKKEASTACGFSKWWRLDFLVQNSCVCRMRMVFMKGKCERMSIEFLKFFASPCNWCLVRWK